MVGDTAGVPVSPGSQARVQSWSPEDFDIAEFVCRPHAWDYSLETILTQMQFRADIDRPTQKVVAYHGHVNQMEQEVTIWMDGRPRPPANTLHTWSGFSTGEWDGDVLVVTTTHLKEAYIRRMGMMRSDLATVRTRWRRIGNYLQATVIIYDPVYLTEPYIRSTMMWEYDPAMPMWPYPCEDATETAVPRGEVRHFLPGHESAARAQSQARRSVQYAVPGEAGRRRDDVSRVHREDENVPAAPARRRRAARPRTSATSFPTCPDTNLMNRKSLAPVLGLAFILSATPVIGQVDFTGLWRPIPRDSDGSGMIGDTAGIPLSDGSQGRVQSWSPEDFDIAEWVCRPHAWDYSLETLLTDLQFWADIDRPTQKVVAYHGHLNQQEQETTIWMDGRPHPPANALHTWSGFSTGEWDGDVLVVTTTHLKETYIRRVGTDAKRSGDRAYAVAPGRQFPAGNVDPVRPGLHDGAVHPQLDDVAIRSRHGDVPVSLRRRHRDRRAARRGPALPSREESAPGPEPGSCGSIRHALPAEARRRRDDVPGVHRQDEDLPTSTHARAPRGDRGRVDGSHGHGARSARARLTAATRHSRRAR